MLVFILELFDTCTTSDILSYWLTLFGKLMAVFLCQL